MTAAGADAASRAPDLGAPLAHPLGRTLLGGFVLVHLVLAVTGDPRGLFPAAAVALGLAVSAAALVVLIPGERLPAVPGVTVAAALLAVVALVTWSLPRGGWPGYASWHFGAVTFVCLGLTLRRRMVTAWLVLAGTAMITVIWSTSTGQGPLHGVDLVIRHAGTLLLGTLFAVGLRRAATAVAALHEVERTRTAAELAATESRRVRRQAVDRVLRLAGPALAAIAAGDQADETRRRDYLVVEGRLRDAIAAPGLQSEDLAAAAAAARRRGVDVALTSALEVGSLSAEQHEEATRWLQEHLERARLRFLGRARLEGNAVRIACVTDDEPHELVLGDRPAG